MQLFLFSLPCSNHAPSVHGLHAECQHGPGIQRLPDRSCHQQNLWLGEDPGMMEAESSLGPQLQKQTSLLLSSGGGLESDR